MAKIICVTSGLTGILNASIELIARLKASGHDLLYASPAAVTEKVRLQGIDFVQLPGISLHPCPELPTFSGPLKKLSRFFYKIKNASKLRKQALDNTEPHAFAKILETEQPDLLIIDIELHEYIFKTYQKNIPLVLLSQWFSLWKRPGLPYLLHDTIPGNGWKGQPWAIGFSWALVRLQRWWTFSKQRLYSVGTDRRSILLDLAKKGKFPLALLAENNWPGPFTYAQLPVISMTAEELEFPHTVRPNLFYVGPMVAENRKDLSANEDTISRLHKIFEQKKTSGAMLIYCSVSTLHQGDQLFIKKIIAAVEKRSDWILIIGLGGLVSDKQFGDLPANVHAFSYVPQLLVLKEADCSVNHGGIHTINECIHFKVPMLVYSGKRSDQNGCAARIAYHGLGIMADKDKDSAVEIETKIAAILSNDSFYEKVCTYHEHYLQYKKDRRAEQVVARFLSPKVDHQQILTT